MSCQNQDEGSVGEKLPKRIYLESVGSERKVPTETGDATAVKDRLIIGRIADTSYSEKTDLMTCVQQRLRLHSYR